MGFSIIRSNGKRIELMEMNVLKPGVQKDIYKRLHLIHETICGLVLKYKPDEFAIEAPFFGKNVQSMLKLGRAQGVAIAAAMQAGISVTEYSPKKVKQAITGNGNADKEQVWKMLRQIIPGEEKPKHFDATDALAVAVCHHYQCQRPVAVPPQTKKSARKKNGWSSFISANPGRVG
jgi:crossover junction endodeoxyribonuclease RuvC